MTYENAFEHHDNSRTSWTRRAYESARKIITNWGNRLALSSSLGALPDHMLRDIGLTAADVESALHEASFASETDRLGERAKTQSQNW
ncbi:DUF1127 domain-containing protein [Marimonas sp. MJW-29]|uniref:DUF1127 domain-containing protein n=1 Tax=Sulfitobacter sediminis TaxID=3234186 RepID=A0ABV3RW17_9RHOB